MQRRTLLLSVAALTVVTLLCCGVLGIGGMLFVRRQGPIQITLGEPAAPPTSNVTPVVARDATATAVPPPTLAALPSATPIPATVAPLPTATTLTSADGSEDAPMLPAGPLPDFASALAAESRGALAQQPAAPLYRIRATLDPDAATITGAQSVRVTNGEDAPLSELYFRLYPNANHYDEGGMAISEVQVNGQPAPTSLEVDDTALRVALPQPLASGGAVEVTLRFVTTVPEAGGYGIFSVADGTFALYHWHPELAVFEEGGWLLNPVAEQGDPTNTDAANYEVELVAPDGMQVVSGGVETEQPAADGTVTHRIVAALTRNLVIVAGAGFEVASVEQGGRTVNAWFLPGDEAGGRETLEVAASSLALFGERFAPYPYPELDVVEVRLGGGAAGMEAPGLIMIGRDLYDPASDPMAGLGALIPGGDAGSALAFTTAHEVAHQWWYGVVGSNAFQQPWLDEALTNWSAAFWVDETEGEEAGLLARDLFITLPYQLTLADGDQRLDQPVTAFDQMEYAAVVYGKGALMYDVLRDEIGDDSFFQFLQRYGAAHQFARADGDDWRAALAEVAGQGVANDFYATWVEGDDVTADDLPPGGPLSELLGDFDLGSLGDLFGGLEVEP